MSAERSRTVQRVEQFFSAERVVNHGDYLTIDVGGLSAELVASSRPTTGSWKV